MIAFLRRLQREHERLALADRANRLHLIDDRKLAHAVRQAVKIEFEFAFSLAIGARLRPIIVRWRLHILTQITSGTSRSTRPPMAESHTGKARTLQHSRTGVPDLRHNAEPANRGNH